MVWTCLFRPSGIPVPRSGAVHVPHFFLYIAFKNTENMRKITLYIASSIDGYIADINSDIDWLSNYSITSTMNYGYDKFFESVDTVIMGWKTYRDILNMDVVYPYKNKTSYIITRNRINKPSENFHFITDNIIETIVSLREKRGKDIWLVGGGELISMFLNHDLIDEMIISYIPITLGDGIPLFPKSKKEFNWKLIDSKPYDNGVLTVDYQRII